jgi:hypothetical protein
MEAINDMKKILFILLTLVGLDCNAQHTEYFKYGNFNNWITRHIKESAVIGGDEKTIYEIGPKQTLTGNVAYTPKGGSPWGTSNVYAKVSGVVKTSNAVYPHTRKSGDRCAKLCTQMEHVKVLGLINMDVMVSGSIFMGGCSNLSQAPKTLIAKWRWAFPTPNAPTTSFSIIRWICPKAIQGQNPQDSGARRPFPAKIRQWCL